VGGTSSGGAAVGGTSAGGAATGGAAAGGSTWKQCNAGDKMPTNPTLSVDPAATGYTTAISSIHVVMLIGPNRPSCITDEVAKRDLAFLDEGLREVVELVGFPAFPKWKKGYYLNWVILNSGFPGVTLPDEGGHQGNRWGHMNFESTYTIADPEHAERAHRVDGAQHRRFGSWPRGSERQDVGEHPGARYGGENFFLSLNQTMGRGFVNCLWIDAPANNQKSIFQILQTFSGEAGVANAIMTFAAKSAILDFEGWWLQLPMQTPLPAVTTTRTRASMLRSTSATRRAS
jgi:hypothetical protein